MELYKKGGIISLLRTNIYSQNANMQKRISQALKHNDRLLGSFEKLKDRQSQLEQQRARIQNSLDEMMSDDPHYKKIVAKLDMADARFDRAVKKMLKIEHHISKKLQQE